MAGEITKEQLAEEVYKTVAESAGKKKLKATDIQREMSQKYGASRQEIKDAIKMNIDSGRLIYGYFGGSSIELPRVEGAANE